MNKPVLLICSCINVFAPTKVPDVEQRKTDYLNTLKFFVTKSDIKRIIILENTNTPWVTDELYELSGIYEKKIELLTFAGNVEMCIKYSIGYSHFEMVHHAFNSSQLLSESDSLLIMDGRYEIRNINRIYRNLDNGYSAFIPEIHRFKKTNLCDPRLYMVTKDVFHDFIWPLRERLSNNKTGWAETILDTILKEKGFPFESFVTFPRFVGVQGSTGVNWDGNNIIKYWIKKSVIFVLGLLKY